MKRSVTAVFAERLKALRRAKGVSGEALGPALNFSKHLIYEYEGGLVEPKISSVMAIAKYFGVTLDYLCGASDIPRPDAQESVIAKYKDDLKFSRETFRQIQEMCDGQMVRNDFESGQEVFRQIREMCDEQIAKKEGEI